MLLLLRCPSSLSASIPDHYLIWPPSCTSSSCPVTHFTLHSVIPLHRLNFGFLQRTEPLSLYTGVCTCSHTQTLVQMCARVRTHTHICVSCPLIGHSEALQNPSLKLDCYGLASMGHLFARESSIRCLLCTPGMFGRQSSFLHLEPTS